MTNDTTGLRDVFRRLERLERQNRRLRRGLLAGGALAIAVALMGQAGLQRSVQAEEFVLRHASGSVRGQWVAGDQGATLDLHGPHKRVALRLETDAEGSRVSLYDRAGRARLGLVHSFDDGPTLALLEPDGARRIVVRDGAAGAAIELFADGGVRRAALGVTATGPALALADAAGRERVHLDAAARGPGLSLSAADGKPRAILRAFGAEGPQLSLLDRTGDVFWQTPRP